MNKRPYTPKVAKRLDSTFVEIAFESLFQLAWLPSLQPQDSIRRFGSPGLPTGHLPFPSSSRSRKEIMLGHLQSWFKKQCQKYWLGHQRRLEDAPSCQQAVDINCAATVCLAEGGAWRSHTFSCSLMSFNNWLRCQWGNSGRLHYLTEFGSDDNLHLKKQQQFM